MVSARELLEQASALMRRNRGRSDTADIPVLTDVVTETAVVVSPLPTADVPVLTDVAEEVVVDSVPLPGKTFRSPGAFEGDPSDWLVADTVDPAMHSVTGRPPDTLSVVPAVTLKAAGSAATPPPEGSQRNLREVAAAQQPEGSLQRAIDEAAAAQLKDAEEPSLRDEQGTSDPRRPPSLREEVEVNGSPLQFHWPREEFESPTPDPTQREAEETAERPSSEDESRSGGDAGRARTESPPQPLRDLKPRLSVGPSEVEQEEERWRSLAEQISMQVLQRIDLFTDTGLKEQLAAHLQPIVERAGAELVSAINMHVGRLLRAYVAEAIEREITQWRDSQR
jgi:hypothetical protein